MADAMTNIVVRRSLRSGTMGASTARALRPLRLALALVAALGWTALASAGESLGDDEVSLKNGGMIRGTVLSTEPGQKVVIKESATGKMRTIPWGQVADVQRGKYAEKKNTQPGDAGPGYEGPDVEEAPAAGVGVVKVHIDSPEPVAIFEQVATSVASVGVYAVAVGHNAAVCESPCDLLIDGRRGQDFYVIGDGIPGSDFFKLSKYQGDVTVKVDPGSNIALDAGWIMLWPSIGLSTVSGLVFGLAVANAPDSPGFVAAGGVGLGVGLGLLVTSIILIATGPTGIEVVAGPPGPTASRPREVKPRYWAGEF